jgi:CRISPR-associated endonuclease/helicase Cas3
MHKTQSANPSLPVAHISQTESGEWRFHWLSDHLNTVAHLAAESAQLFGSEEWAKLAGLWHDLGKYRPRFQRYIGNASGYNPDAHIQGEPQVGKSERPGKAPHSTAGALLACEKFGINGRILAYLIAGHHAGLYDWNSENSSLQYRLETDTAQQEYAEALAANPPAEILNAATNFKPDLR